MKNFKRSTSVPPIAGLNFLLLFCLAVSNAYAQPSIQGMYAYSDVNGTTPLDSVQACDSVYFFVYLNTSTPSSNYAILLDNVYNESYDYTTMQQYEVAGGYKVFFKIPCSFTPHSNHNWAIGTSSSVPIFVYSTQTTSIISAYQQNKEGIINIYDTQGRLVKTSSINDYQKGLQLGTLYIYIATYFDNTFDKGKFIIE